jgi:hypothetical protein
MSTLAVQPILLTGLKPVLAEIGSNPNGDVFPNDGKTFIYVLNGAGENVEITVNSQTACNFGTDHDAVVAAIIDGEIRLIGPFPKDRFNDANGRVQVVSDVVTGTDIAIISLP